MGDLNPTAASLLGFLHHGSMTGWDLARVVEGSIGYFWNVTRSQIYRELRTLETARFVQVGETGAREKRPFSITDAGRAAFGAWIAREPGPELIRFPLLLTLFFGEHLEEQQIQRFLIGHRLGHEQRLERYRELLRPLDQHQPFVAVTLRFGVAYEEAVLRWFDSLPWLAESAPPPRRPGASPRVREARKRGARKQKVRRTRRR